MNDPDHILCSPKFRQEQLLLEAAWRYQLIAPLISDATSKEQKESVRARLTSSPQPHPWRGAVRVSARTLRRWCRSYRQQQLGGLKLQPRRDAGKQRQLPEGALEQARQLWREDPRRSVPALIRLLQSQNPGWASIARSTLGRHLRAAGLRRDAQPTRSYTRFEAEDPNQLWQGDVLHGPKVVHDGKTVTAKVVCWIDDHSRYVVHLQAYANERLPVLEDTLTRALAKHGRPRTVLVDNGKIYSSKVFTLACSELGIHKVHAAPYHPETKGKQERFFRTLREQLLNEVEHLEPVPLERLNQLLHCWLQQYHQTVHSSTKQTPKDRYARVQIDPVSREQTEEAFLQWELRKVSPQGVVELGGQSYHADPSLAGQQVIVRFNPFDLSRIVLWRDGRKLGQATSTCLVQATLPRAGRPHDRKRSEAAARYLEDLERTQQRKLQTELNLIQLQEGGGLE